ncbi:MAG TPA: hypothetical protein VLG50_04320, partial [Candidatus Saccharimonadales bacterium]|nr:hypothetical protein [Candidatus Saccharimonadales bacterium]
MKSLLLISALTLSAGAFASQAYYTPRTSETSTPTTSEAPFTPTTNQTSYTPRTRSILNNGAAAATTEQIIHLRNNVLPNISSADEHNNVLYFIINAEEFARRQTERQAARTRAQETQPTSNVPNVPFAQVNLLEAFVYATLNSFPAINPHPVFSGVPEFRLAQHSS